MGKKGVMVEEWKREKVVLAKVLFVLFDCVFASSLFIHNQNCGHLSVNLLAACYPHSLKKREVGMIALWPHARAC